MTPLEKFLAFTRQAEHLLEHPLEAASVPGRGALSPAVRIWSYPSFEPYSSWSLVQVGRRPEARYWLAIKVTWDRPRDAHSAHDPLLIPRFMTDPDVKPTVSVRTARVTDEFAESVLDALRRISIPTLLPQHGVYLDGVEYGIETERGWLRAKWWCEYPPEWRSLIQTVEALRGDLDGAILDPEATPDSPKEEGGAP